MSTTVCPAPKNPASPFSPNSPRSTSGVSGTMIKITSACAATAAGLSHARAPAWMRSSGTPLRVNAASATPFLRRVAAMGLPMMPSPIKPAFCMECSEDVMAAGLLLARLFLHEVFLNRLRSRFQQPHIRADRDDAAAPGVVALRVGLHRRENAARLARGLRAFEHARDRR